MSRPQLYHIRFMAKVRPNGWHLVEGKTFMLLASKEEPPHFIPADPRWPKGAPTRIAQGDAESATQPPMPR